MNGVLEKGFHLGILRMNADQGTIVAATDPSHTIQADRYIEDLVDEVERLQGIINGYLGKELTDDYNLKKENEALKDKLNRFANAVRQHQYDTDVVQERLATYFQILAEP